MADKKISQLTAATTPLAGTEVLPVVQGGTTVKVSVDNLTAGKAVSMAGLTATGDVSLNGGNFVFNDAGANKTARFEGDNDANLLVTDAVNDRIGVGTSAPATKLDVTGLFNGLQARFGFVAGRGLEISTTLSGGTNEAGSVLNAKGAGSGALIIQTDTVDRATFTSAGDLSIANGNLVVGTAGKGIADANGNESMLFTATASAVNELTVANAATGSPPAISATGGDTNIGLSLVTKGSGGLRLNSALNRFVRTGTNGDTTVAATISFVSQGSDWISQLVEFQVALSSSAGSSVHGGVVRYILSSLDSGTGLANVTALASDLTGVTAATSVSGNDLTVTFTITGGGNAIRYGISAEVLSSNGAGWVASGMTVA